MFDKESGDPESRNRSLPVDVEQRVIDAPIELDRIRITDRVTIYPRGKKRLWVADFFFDGVHRRVSLKTSNKREAMKRAQKLSVDLDEGQFQRKATPIGLGDAIARYLASLEARGNAKRTNRCYATVLDDLAKFAEQRRIAHLHRIGHHFLDEFVTHRRQERQHSAKTIYHHVTIVKQLFRFAVRQKLIREYPLDGYQVAKPVPTPMPGPTLDQIHALLASASARLKPMLAMLAFTGMRSGELRNLRREDVDLETGFISIRSREGSETKSRRSRKVPIHSALIPYLQMVPTSKGEWLFTAQPSERYPAGGNQISQKRLNEDFQTLARRLGLKTGRKTEGGFVIHSIRHFFETIAVNSGVPTRVVDRWLDHQSRDRSIGAMYYYDLPDADSKRFMEQITFGVGTSAAVAGV
jgi:integrase